MFRAIWIAALASNIGTWMHDMAASWVMTNLTHSTLLIALVQTATLGPVLLLTPVAGAMADVVDRRRLVIASQWWMLAAALALGTVTLIGVVTPVLLLALTFLLNVGTAVGTPAWFSVVPDMVLPRRASQAITLNSVAFNSARALGPVLGGVLISRAGPSAAFLLNAASFLAVIVALHRWRRRPDAPHARVRMGDALHGELAGAMHAGALRGLAGRAVAFGVTGAALWGFLPAIAREQLHLDAMRYGLLFGCVGAGVFGGTPVVSAAQRALSVARVLASCTALFGVAMYVVAHAGTAGLVAPALVGAGAAWVGINSTFIIGVQRASPPPRRGGAMAVYLTGLLGATALGSAAWGWCGGIFGVRATLSIAAGLVVVTAVAMLSIPALQTQPSA